MTLQEVLQISDLNKDKALSAFTATFKDLRKSTLGSEKALASCEAAGIAENDDDVVFVFTTPSTYGGFKISNPKQNFGLQNSSDGKYRLWVCVVECLSALKAIRGENLGDTEDSDEEETEIPEEDLEEPEPKPEQEEDASDEDVEKEQDEEADRLTSTQNTNQRESRLYREAFQAITKDEISQIIEVCDVKIWSDTPAFHWQGANYHLSQMDAALYPTNVKPQKWDKYHRGDNYLDKHTQGLVNDLPHFYGQMAQRLTDIVSKRKDTLT